MRYFREILVRNLIHNLIHGIVGIYHVDPYSSQKNQGFQLFDFFGWFGFQVRPPIKVQMFTESCASTLRVRQQGGLTMFVCMGLSPIATNPHSSS